MIGIFDSGVGGLTVVKEIRKLLPQQDLLYFGDTARLPYGNKSAETVQQYALENALFLASHNVQAIVIACNTASAHALETVRQAVNVPVLGVIEPAIQSCQGKGRIGLIATKSTIKSNIYPYKQQIACPLFVPLAEEQLWDHPITQAVAEHYLAPLRDKIDTLLLGCTHYPLLKETIQKIVGEKIEIIDSATTTAQQLATLTTTPKHRKIGSQTYYVSDDPESFATLGSTFLGEPLDNVRLHHHAPPTSKIRAPNNVIERLGTGNPSPNTSTSTKR